jgi:hypothetical protein
MFRRATIATAVCLATIVAARAEDQIALACAYQSSVDDKGIATQITGSLSLLVHLAADGTITGASSKCNGNGLTGTYNEVEVNGHCEYDLGPNHILDQFTIDRVTGRIKELWLVAAGKGVVFYASCRLTQRLF